MRVLVIGGTGMLGHKLVQVLGPDFDVWTTIRRRFEEVERFGIFDGNTTTADIDVEDHAKLREAILRAEPDVVINAVGIIKQLETPKQINEVLPHKLAEFSAEFGFRLICISTDCVFSGETGNYNEADKPDATDIYGMSKARGEVTENNCLTIRTSIIGRELDTSHSLVEWFLSNRGGTVGGFTNVIYTGFPTIVLAEILLRVISDQPKLSGLFHVSSDPISKYDLLKLIDDNYRAGVNIVPTAELHNDRSLDSSKFRALTGFTPEPWAEMVRRMAADPTAYDDFRHR
ncbi:NAD(P)-dependent oxidoreductase [soil metagenome]